MFELSVKSDIPGAMNASEVITELELETLSKRWHAVSSNALSGFGLNEGFSWISASVSAHLTGTPHSSRAAQSDPKR